MPKFSFLSTACVAAAFLGAGLCNTASAQWGTVKGQVLLDGEPPAKTQKVLVVKGDAQAKDAAVCAAQDVPNESLVVNPTSKGIANVVVYLQKKPAKIAPSVAKSEKSQVTFDQAGCRFLPHVLLVRTDQTVLVLSDDEAAHNTHTYPIKNRQDNFVVAPKDRTGVSVKPLTVAERLPVKVKCDIHPWMEAYWVIVDHPYAAITDENGEFTITDLPVGSHEFIVWQETAGYLEKKYVVNVKEGENVQKPLKVSAKMFDK
ncbi:MULTISPECIES: hypothetical protein [unclassified Schlesneria]|uniref:hypothetical protein n=1 Tax=Schlesneria TaxID=656899 RepID=UPI0035A14AF5